MQNARPATPRGFRDVMPQEAAERERVSASVTRVFDAWAYEPVETPVVEFDRVLEMAAGSLEHTALRLIDVDGSLLALRPDMTLPVARVVATRLPDAARPLRLRYAAPVFRERESLRGEAREFTQLGVELVGVEGPAADAEVIGLLVDSLAATGLDDFSVGVGTVAVLDALLSASGEPGTWQTAVRRAVHDRDLVRVDELAGQSPGAQRAVAVLRQILRMRGGRDVISTCRDALSEVGVPDVLDDLEAAWSLLEAAGHTERVRIDFGIMRQFDYYTGMVLEAYAPGVGLPLGGGGRYDRALAAFGSPAPAAGFALGLERLMIALVEQDSVPPPAQLDVVLGGSAGDVFGMAEQLRAEGKRVALAAGVRSEELARLARELGARAAAQAEADGRLTWLDLSEGVVE